MPAPPLFAALFLLAPAAGPTAEPTAAPLPTVAELAGSLTATRAAVRRAHVVLTERTRPSAAGGGPADTGPKVHWEAAWSEAFLDGDHLQWRVDRGPVRWDRWKAGTPAGAPLTGATAAAYGGQAIYCLRPAGGGPVRLEVNPSAAPAGGLHFPAVYDAENWYGAETLLGGPADRFIDASLIRSPASRLVAVRLLPPVPLLFADRVWGDPDGEGVTSLMGSPR